MSEITLPPGRELDAMVWQALNGEEINLLACRHVDGDWQPYAGYPVGHISPPPYSTDIAAAWEMVERMKQLASERDTDTFGLKLVHWDTVEGVDYWAASFSYTSDTDWFMKHSIADLSVSAKSAEALTAPHAICLAALAALQEHGRED